MLHNPLIVRGLPLRTSQLWNTVINSQRPTPNTVLIAGGLPPRAPRLLCLGIINRS